MLSSLTLDLNQILGGPNDRTDYHVNETPEWFYQYRGSMELNIIDPTDDNKFKTIKIREGEMFLLPGSTPHNPVRFADTAGVVIEQKRPEGSVDRLRWYCQNCRHLVHEVSFHLKDLGTEIKNAVLEFKNSGEARRCQKCGVLCAVSH